MTADTLQTQNREGGLDAPTRHPLNWREESFFDEENLNKELERVFDICHGCRRCVSLCEAFPTLFDLIDESADFEVESVDKKDYVKVSDECYLCDLCYQTKCPYVPPHPWQLDFPQLMLRAKAVKYRKQGARWRDRIITSTDRIGSLASLPIVRPLVNSLNRKPSWRRILEKIMAIASNAPLPLYRSNRQLKKLRNNGKESAPGTEAAGTTGKVAIFASCHGNYSRPEIIEDLLTVLQHNGIEARLLPQERCCGMPKLELGDLEAAEHAKNFNIPVLAEAINDGWDIIAPVPSCVLMFKQQLPLMFPEEEQVAEVSKHFFDPFEYLSIRHRQQLLKTDFSSSLGKIAYQVACHQRVQNIGQRTREVLSLIPGVEIELIERCSGHDGTYAVRQESRKFAEKIVRPVARKVSESECDVHTSDCPLAADHISHALGQDTLAPHPITLLKQAYAL